MAGLLIAAVLCLGYAWLRRDPVMALVTDRADITAMLWRTTIVVGVSAVAVIGGFVLGGLRRQALDRRAKFMAYASPVLAVVGIAGINNLLGPGRTAEIFTAATKQQEALDPFDATSVARTAWWCACLAVLALALVAVAGYWASRSSAPLEPPRGEATAAVVAMFVVGIVAIAVFTFDRPESPINAQTATRIGAPELSEVSGTVAYRVDAGRSDAVVPAGAGFVRATDNPLPGSGHGVEGFDGATGESRWMLGIRDTRSSKIAATGVGPDSVVVAVDTDKMMGVDATTGTPLWVRTTGSFPDWEHPGDAVSAGVVLVSQTEPTSSTSAARGTRLDALAPRTGDVLWSKTFGYRCGPRVNATDTAVVVQSCDDDPDVTARVLDPATGAERSAIRQSVVGGSHFTLYAAKNDVGLAEVSQNSSVVVDLGSGKVVYHAPEGSHPTLVDDATLVLTGPQFSVVDLKTGAVTPTTLMPTRYLGAGHAAFGAASAPNC